LSRRKIFSFKRGPRLYLGAFVLSVGLIYMMRATLLREVAFFLRVEDPLAQADFIFTLSGDSLTRAPRAAEIYKEGWSPLIILTHPPYGSSDEYDFILPREEVYRKILLLKGVPKRKIHVRPEIVASTFDEAVLLENILEESPEARRVIVVTSASHTRRARWIIRKVIKGKNVELLMAVAEHPMYSERNWWQSERGLIDYFNEYAKWIVYL